MDSIMEQPFKLQFINSSLIACIHIMSVVLFQLKRKQLKLVLESSTNSELSWASHIVSIHENWILRGKCLHENI